MLVAAVADTHLRRSARVLPPECVRRLTRADLVLHAGDHSSLAALQALRALGPPVAAVHGNADEPALRESLPPQLVVEAEGVRIGLLHAPGPREGREARLLRRLPGCDAIVFGHTHVPVVERHDGVWLLNPGSPTERRRAPAHTMLELRIAGGEVVPELIVL